MNNHQGPESDVHSRDYGIPDQGVFRYRTDNGLGSALFVAAGTFFSLLAVFSASPGIVAFPMVFIVLGLAYFIPFWNRRVEADRQGLRVFDAWGRCLLNAPWDQITGYQATSPIQGYQGGWGVETASGAVELPRVDAEDRLQTIIVRQLSPGVLRQRPRDKRPSTKWQTGEVHLSNYVDSKDYATLFICVFGLVLLGGSAAILVASVMDGRIANNPLEGLGVGVLITLILVACRWILRRSKLVLKGRQIDMTPTGISLRENGREQAIAWTDLVLVEKRYLSDFNRQGSFVMLFDGRTGIAYPEKWKHADALVRYVSQKAPPETVFAGFDL